MTKKEKGKRVKAYDRTKKGLLAKMYSSQRASSKSRGMPMPTYTSQEFREALLNLAYFHELYDQWVENNYLTGLKPSIDRIDDYLPYTEDNIQLMTWQENRAKYHKDTKNGKNTKHNKKVEQFSLDGEYIATYYSMSEAERQTGAHVAVIHKCCKGIAGSANKFKWQYAEGV